MSETPEQVLADARGDAAVLRRKGHSREAEEIESLCDRFAAAAEPWMKKLTEAEARMKSGRSIRWLRAQAPSWEAIGMAERDGNRWIFRDCIIQQRGHVSVVREDARRAAQGTGRAA